MIYAEQEEQRILLRQKTGSDDRAKHLFEAIKSHGANNRKLAQLLTALDFGLKLLDIECNLTDIVVNYQASIDSKYHEDYKQVATTEEIDRRLALRRRTVNATEQADKMS